MTKDQFEIYRMPIGLTDGVDIALPNTTAVFTVILPGNSNDAFQMALIARMNVNVDDEQLKIDPIKFVETQKELFFKICIKSAVGLPKKMEASKFLAEYPLAAKYLWQEAQRLAGIADREVNEALGKSWPSLNGNASGEGVSTSMTN